MSYEISKMLVVIFLGLTLSGCDMKPENKEAVGRFVPLGNTGMILDTTNGVTYKPMNISGTLTWELFIQRLATSDQKRP